MLSVFHFKIHVLLVVHSESLLTCQKLMISVQLHVYFYWLHRCHSFRQQPNLHSQSTVQGLNECVRQKSSISARNRYFKPRLDLQPGHKRQISQALRRYLIYRAAGADHILILKLIQIKCISLMQIIIRNSLCFTLYFTFCGKSQKEAGSQDSVETLAVCQNMGLVMLMCRIFWHKK